MFGLSFCGSTGNPLGSALKIVEPLTVFMSESIMRQRDLNDLYWRSGLSTRKIAALFHTHQKRILDFMAVYGIPRRNRIQAVVAGCTKYVKPPFAGDLTEKAYLLGLAFADFRRRRHGFQVDISLHTTHPAFVRLFKSIFGRYAPLRE